MCSCVFVCVLQTHSNETIGSIRWKISEHLSCPVDNVQIFANDSVVSLHVNLSVTGTLCSSFVLKTELYLSCPHQSIVPLSQSCVSPEASSHYKLQISAQKKSVRAGHHLLFVDGLVRRIHCAAGETQTRTTSIPVFLSRRPFTAPPPCVS